MQTRLTILGSEWENVQGLCSVCVCVIGWWWLGDCLQVCAWSVQTAVLVQWMMGNVVLEWSVTDCVVWKSMWWVSGAKFMAWICDTRCTSLIHIGKCLHNISLSYNAEIISVVFASLASEQSCHGPTGPLAHCETEMVPGIDSKKHISKPSNTWIHLTCVLLLKVQTGELQGLYLGISFLVKIFYFFRLGYLLHFMNQFILQFKFCRKPSRKPFM